MGRKLRAKMNAEIVPLVDGQESMPLESELNSLTSPLFT